jgi:hypothetical protein
MFSGAGIETLIDNPGLSFLVVDVFLTLDCQSLANCELVSTIVIIFFANIFCILLTNWCRILLYFFANYTN